MLKKIAKNIIKNEAYLLGFILIQEIIRILMKVRDDLAISFVQVIIMAIIVAILSIIQQLVKKN